MEFTKITFVEKTTDGELRSLVALKSKPLIKGRYRQQVRTENVEAFVKKICLALSIAVVVTVATQAVAKVFVF